MNDLLRHRLMFLLVLALAGLAAASGAPAPGPPRTVASGLQPDDQNVCLTGRMRWLLTAAYGGFDVCRNKGVDMVAHIHKVAELRAGAEKYELYDYDYSFRAAAVRHGGARLLVVKNGKYAGEYDGAAGGVWEIHGAVAILFWPKTSLVTRVDFSKGLPRALQQPDGRYTFLE